MPSYENLRKMWDTRWTPLTAEFQAEVQKVIDEAGGISSLGDIIGMKPRHIRRLIRGHGKMVSFRVADQIFSRSERSLFLLDVPWYTVEEAQKMRIWNPQWGHSLESLKSLRDDPEEKDQK